MNCQGQLNNNYRHGKASCRIYWIWTQMKQRCLNPEHPRYKDYGGRGIKVCDSWLLFENFYSDMGDRPEGKTLERKNNNGNYEPDNCIWATIIAQNNNTKNNRYIEFRGESKTITEWSRITGIPRLRIHKRLSRGVSIEMALTVVVRATRNQLQENN